MAWKFFKPTNDDVLSNIDKLTKEFGPYQFKNVQYNGKQGILVLKDAITKFIKYNDPISSLQFEGVLYFGVSEPDKYDWSTDENKDISDEWKIPVRLLNNKIIKIVPATLEPRKMTFGRIPQVSNNPYSQVSEYGKIAFNIFNKYDGKEIDWSDNQIPLFVQLSLQKSYHLPLDVWNDLGVITNQDIGNIFFAAMGRESVDITKKKESSS